jgi:RNA polymerase sigma-70 factor (ECF subfamily)
MTMRSSAWTEQWGSVCAGGTETHHTLGPDLRSRERAVKEDQVLIAETLAGDAAAFGMLVRKYQDRLYNAIVQSLGMWDEAHDVVQDAFVQAFLKLHSFQGQSQFYTWLYRIAFNTAASRRRKQRPNLSLDHSRENGGHEPLYAGEAPHDRAMQSERIDSVQRALSTLTDDHRTILVLREIDGMAYEDIAEILELPVGTVRSRLFRARMQLREELREVVEDERV